MSWARAALGAARRDARRAGAESSPNSEAASCALPLGSLSRAACVPLCASLRAGAGAAGTHHSVWVTCCVQCWATQRIYSSCLKLLADLLSLQTDILSSVAHERGNLGDTLLCLSMPAPLVRMP